MQDIIAPSTNRSLDQRIIDPASKILNRVTRYVKNLDKSMQSSGSNMRISLTNAAQRQKEEVRLAIEEARRQKELFRRLQTTDEVKRHNLRSNIEIRQNKNQQKKRIFTQSRVKSLKQTNTHIRQTFAQHRSLEKKFEKKCETQHRVATENMVNFYKEEQKNLKQYWHKIERIKTCSGDARFYIEQREAKSRLYALNTEKELEESLSNHSKVVPSPQQAEWIQKRNLKFRGALRNSSQINATTHQRYIDKYCIQLEQVRKAFEKRQEENSKRSQKIRRFIKETYAHTRSKKKQIMATHLRPAQKCQERMNKSAQNSFRVTRSTFHDTCQSWVTKNSFVKGCLKDQQRLRQDEILNKHQELRRKRSQHSRLTTNMDDYRRNAEFLAKEFL